MIRIVPVLRVLSICTVLSVAGVLHCLGQSNRIIPVEDWTYEYISRLQRRGHLLELHPTALPYTQGDVLSALERIERRRLSDVERSWVELLESELGIRKKSDRQGHLYGAIEVGTRFSSSDRLDVLRPLDANRSHLQAGDIRVFPNAMANVVYEQGPVVGSLQLQHDVFYDTDPDGIDAVTRLYVRSENTYVGYTSRIASVFLGRFSNQWGPYDRPATVISANPRSYDQLNLRLGRGPLSLRSLLGELDNVGEDGTFTGRDFEGEYKRRFLAAHRIDWRPSRFFNLSFMEAALYSGRSSGPSLKYLNPLHAFAFEVDNNPKNDENNGLLAGSLWAYYRGLTIEGQLLLDDFDILSESGEKGSLALTGNLLYAGLSKHVDAGATFELVTARVYNTHQPEGRYIYLNRGLATQFSDYVAVEAFTDVYPELGINGIIVTPRITMLWQGERDIRQLYPRNDEDVGLILTGDVTRTLRLSASLRLQPTRWWWLRADVGHNFTSVAGDESTTRLVGLVEFGARLSLSRPIRASI